MKCPITNPYGESYFPFVCFNFRVDEFILFPLLLIGSKRLPTWITLQQQKRVLYLLYIEMAKHKSLNQAKCSVALGELFNGCSRTKWKTRNNLSIDTLNLGVVYLYIESTQFSHECFPTTQHSHRIFYLWFIYDVISFSNLFTERANSITVDLRKKIHEIKISAFFFLVNTNR